MHNYYQYNLLTKKKKKKKKKERKKERKQTERKKTEKEESKYIFTECTHYNCTSFIYYLFVCLHLSWIGQINRERNNKVGPVFFVL